MSPGVRAKYLIMTKLEISLGHVAPFSASAWGMGGQKKGKGIVIFCQNTVTEPPSKIQ